jgi:hypothetical protein
MGVNEHERLTSITLGQKIRNIVVVAVLQFTVTVASSTISISLKTDSCCTPDYFPDFSNSFISLV